MDRGASSPFIAELLKSTNSPCFLVEAYFDDGVIRMTDAWRDVAWNGSTFVANGQYLGFDGLTETADLQVPNVTLTVSSVDQTWIATALTKPYLDRRLVIYKGFLDYTQSVVSLPIPIFDGRMDGMVIADNPGGKCTLVVSATSQWGDFDRRPGRHTNPSEQQVFFPGDLFFQYCSQLNKDIKWGAA